MTIILVAQALSGIILPVVAIYLFYVTSNKKQMGDYRNTSLKIYLSVGAVLVTVVI